jgi:hypothetical protein
MLTAISVETKGVALRLSGSGPRPPPPPPPQQPPTRHIHKPASAAPDLLSAAPAQSRAFGPVPAPSANLGPDSESALNPRTRPGRAGPHGRCPATPEH